jgi:hypothetical protein
MQAAVGASWFEMRFALLTMRDGGLPVADAPNRHPHWGDQRGMDEIRSTIFSASLRRLLTEALQPGEHVLWQGQPDGIARMMMWQFLWWIGFPWLLLTAVAISKGWIGQSTVPLLMIGVMMVAAPFVMLLHDLQTLFAITNRRALIVRTAWGKPTVAATRFEDMDAALEILDIGRGAGHLNFASAGRAR